MASKEKTRSKGKRVKKVKRLPKHPEKDKIYEMDTKRGTRYFKGSGRELMQQTKKPK